MWVGEPHAPDLMDMIRQAQAAKRGQRLFRESTHLLQRFSRGEITRVLEACVIVVLPVADGTGRRRFLRVAQHLKLRFK